MSETLQQPKTRQQIAGEESTRNPIFLFQSRRIVHTGLPFGYEYDDDSGVVKCSDNEDADEQEYLSDEEMLERECAISYWETERVFATREEGETYGENKAYDYPNGWRVYCVPCEGSLKHRLGDTKESAGVPGVADVLGGELINFHLAGEVVAIYGRSICLDFINQEKNIMQIAYHPRSGASLALEEVVVCRRDYFETLRKGNCSGVWTEG